jgi:SAM-dependent methyltransferase
MRRGWLPLEVSMRWIWYVASAIWALDALRMRVRIKSIPALTPTDQPPSVDYDVVSTAGVTVDARTRAAAAAYAQRQNVALLDLLPFDTPTLLAMGVVQLVDPVAYRTNPIARGHSTGYALMAEAGLLARAGVRPREQVDTVALVGAARRLKTFAINRADLVIAPSLSAPAGNPLATWLGFSAIVGRPSRFALGAQGLTLALLAAGLFVAPVAGAVALAIFHLQPIIVFAGLPLRPRDLGVTVLLRGPLELWNWIRVIRSVGAVPAAPRDHSEALRRAYADRLRHGVEHFFEPRRDTCPVCDSPRLRHRLRTTDLIQHKPGRFVLDECEACRHIFQNPRLSAAGLDFYYGDFYDGLGTAVTEALMGAPLGLYLARARAIDGLGTPTRWLDVGTAHGHFCCAAQQAWPETTFDGLDISSGVEQAEQAGWVKRAYRGLLPDVADSLAGTYDVVSLFHCLEHTPNPRAEIGAARTVLEPGGLLVIEVPDPECPMGRLLGRFWFPWFQPQHLHLLSVTNLTRLLRESGFEPAVVQRRSAHLQVEFSSALMLFLSWLAPRLNAPWRPPSTRMERVTHRLVWSVGGPLVPIAMILDAVVEPLSRRCGLSNAYRLVARRDLQPLLRRDLDVGMRGALDPVAQAV